MIRYSTLLLLILLLSCKQKDTANNILATVGDRHITVAEFKERLTFSPLLDKNTGKTEFLRAIILEKTLAQMEDPSEETKQRIFQRNREATIEAFWDSVIFKDLSIDDSSLWRYYVQSSNKRVIDFAVFESPEEAGIFLEDWKDKGEVEYTFQRDTIGLDGKVLPLEQHIFALSIGEIGTPLTINNKTFVVKPIAVFPLYAISESDFYQKEKSLRKQMLKYEKQRIFFDYVATNFQTKNYRLNKKLFSQVAKRLLKNNFQSMQETNSEQVNVLNLDDELLLTQEIVAFDEGENWMVEKLLKHIAYGPYPIDNSSQAKFSYSLIKAARRVLDDELFYRKALEAESNKTYYVDWQGSMWADFLNTQTILSSRSLTNEMVSQKLSMLDSAEHIRINHSIFDTLEVVQTNMMVIKTHFPKRTIVPPLETRMAPALENVINQIILK